MKLIIGGAYQGKRRYAEENFKGCDIIDNFHLLARELLNAGIDLQEYLRDKADEYCDKVIICEDIFCGIVPLSPQERQWREELGRALAFLARESDEVVRLFCGIGTRIK